MIVSFRHKGLEALFSAGSKRGIPPQYAQKLTDILDQLDAAQEVHDMAYPGADLHPLKGDFVGYWAVKVSGNWRVIFRFADSDALDVDYVDYH